MDLLTASNIEAFEHQPQSHHFVVHLDCFFCHSGIIVHVLTEIPRSTEERIKELRIIFSICRFDRPTFIRGLYQAYLLNNLAFFTSFILQQFSIFNYRKQARTIVCAT